MNELEKKAMSETELLRQIYLKLAGDNPALDTSKALSRNALLRGIAALEFGGSAPLTALEHSELVTLINENEMIPGMNYLITDYKTTYDQPVSGDSMEGELEPIVVRAISDNELDPIAISTIHPKDILYYNVDSDAGIAVGTGSFIQTVPGATKGFIYRRIDTIVNNDLPFDFRQVKFRRWKITSEGTYPNSGYASPQSTTFNGLTVDDTDFDDFYFFSGDYETCQNNTIDQNGKQDILSKCDSVVGNSFYSNTIGNNFHSNTLGNTFNSNTIGGNFHSNTIQDNFYSNTIGHVYRQNIIGNNFRQNTIGGAFYSNTIGEWFNSNTIGGNFYSNTIGAYFVSNTIGNSFYSNTIAGNFRQNTIKDNFISNTIEGNFRSNTIEYNFVNKDLSSATHVYGEYSCDIQKNSGDDWKLIYLNDSNVLTVVDPTD